MKRILIILLVLSIAITAYAVIAGAGVRYVRPMHPQVNTVGMIGHWKLWDGVMSGTAIFDYDLGGKVGTVTDTDAPAAPTLIPTYPGFDFDGANDYISIDHHADFTPTLTPFSISAWIYMHDAADFIIASKGVYNTDGEWQFHTSAGGGLYILFYDENVDNCYLRRRDTTDLRVAHENQWLHVVATYDGGTTFLGMALYINGVDVGDAGNNLGAFVEVSVQQHAVWIGRYEDNYANGLIDDVMFYDKEFTAIEVRNIYEVTRWRYQR